MSRKENIHGGGSKTNKNGLKFEQTTDLNDALIAKGYIIRDSCNIYFTGKYIGKSLSKHSLYKQLLDPNNIDFKKILSKKLLPDDSLYIESTKTIFIIEKKFQNTSGSVDEKLQTCDFKKKQYSKLFAPLNIEVNYIYVLSDWFKKEQYKDVLEYILSVNCAYYFNYIPLDELDLPH